jgi:hypothetical protein
MLEHVIPTPSDVAVHPALAALFPNISQPVVPAAIGRFLPVAEEPVSQPKVKSTAQHTNKNHNNKQQLKTAVPSLLDLIVQGNQRNAGAQQHQVLHQTRAVDVVSSPYNQAKMQPVVDATLFWPNSKPVFFDQRQQYHHQQSMSGAGGAGRDAFSAYVGPQPSSILQYVDGCSSNMPHALAQLLAGGNSTRPQSHTSQVPPSAHNNSPERLPQSVQRLFDSVSEEQQEQNALHNTPQRERSSKTGTGLYHPMGGRVIWRSPGGSRSADLHDTTNPADAARLSSSSDRGNQAAAKGDALACLFEKVAHESTAASAVGDCKQETRSTLQARDGGQLLIGRTSSGRSNVRVAYDRDTLLRCSRSPFTLMPPLMLLHVCNSSELTSALLPKLPRKFDDRQYRMQFD